MAEAASRGPVELHPVAPGGKRIWCKEQKRWLRTEDTPTPGVEEKLVPELPDHMFHVYQVNVLIAGCDHRSWRDFVWGHREC